MTFAQWQASRGITPWSIRPQHIHSTIDHLTKAIARASDSMREFGRLADRLAQTFNSIKEDI